MIYNKTDRAVDKILKTIRKSQLREESVSGVSNIPIPINDNTFPGILAQEEEKISQKINNVKFEDNPFMYNPSNQTVSLTGLLPNMSNLRFYFTNDVSTSLSNGCFIFVEGMVLNEESLKILSILKGHFEIWAKDWDSSSIKEKLNISHENLKRFQEEYSGEKFFNI